MTDPLDPITFPYLTTENFIDLLPTILFEEVKILSEVNFVAPQRFIGSDALSVDSAITLFIPLFIDADTTFSAPSNSVEGAVISIELAQGGTPRTIAWNTVFEFAASTAPTVTATANKTDIFTFRYNGSVWQEIGRVQNMAQT